MTRKIAVDVALLPPPEITKLAIDLNRTFPETVAENYVLDMQTCLPHITLLMGVIDRQQLAEVTKKLTKIAHQCPPRALTITGAKAITQSDNKILSYLTIERTPELQKLHESIVERM